MAGHVIVIDVGKTLSKISLWRPDGALVERRSRPNPRTEADGRRVLDTAGIESWLVEQLGEFARIAPVSDIIPVAHGAAAAIIRDGALAAPPIDYEDKIPAGLRVAYDAGRDPFAVSGSPALGDGLNLGVQFHRIEAEIPDLIAGDAQILLWPQYWAWLLSGVAAAEATSLGCHTDLWKPGAGMPSTMAERRGWARRLPPLRHAGALLGPIRPEWAARTGLPANVHIRCGVHDSNAALVAARGFAEIAHREATLLSTGTWFVAMRMAANPAACLAGLPDGRDCLVNVDVDGRPVPSSRFMGGREIELLTDDDAARIDIAADQPALLAAIPAVVAARAMVLPTFTPGSGPFRNGHGRWIARPANRDVRRASVVLYAALMADAALDLIGASDRILVEGRFASAEAFVRALATLRPNDAVYVSDSENDVSYGALRLIHPSLRPAGALRQVTSLTTPLDLAGYKRDWRDAAEAMEQAA